MTEDSLEPLDPELRRLLAAEARFPAESAATRARVWAGVEAGIAPTPPDGGGGADGGTSGATGAASGAGTGAGKLASVALAAFAAGGISGAAIYHASVEPPEPSVVQVPVPEGSQLSDAGAGADGPGDEAAIADSSASSDAGTAVRRPEAASALPERRRSPTQPRADQPTSEEPPAAEADRSQLARERAIIEVARAGIARGHPGSALSALDRHAREFPHGRLAEERDGLRIIALAKAGRSSEAENEAARFRDRYPNSLLRPAIEAALGSGP